MTFGKIKDPFISLLSHICKLFSREVTNYLTRRFNEKKKNYFQPPFFNKRGSERALVLQTTSTCSEKLYIRPKSIISRCVQRQWAMRKPLLQSIPGQCYRLHSGARPATGMLKFEVFVQQGCYVYPSTRQRSSSQLRIVQHSELGHLNLLCFLSYALDDKITCR